jgi:hypothetical protein
VSAGVTLNGTFDPAIVRKYAERIAQGRWFVNLGLPFDEREIGTVDAYVRATGLGKAVRVTSWDDARTIVDDARARSGAEADAAEVERLESRALAATDRAALTMTMTTIVDGGLEIFFDRAGAAARAARVADPGIIRVAASSASDAVYRAALAAAVGEPETHRFILRHELFVNGRWPLARIDNGFYLF